MATSFGQAKIQVLGKSSQIIQNYVTMKNKELQIGYKMNVIFCKRSEFPQREHENIWYNFGINQIAPMIMWYEM